MAPQLRRIYPFFQPFQHQDYNRTSFDRKKRMENLNFHVCYFSWISIVKSRPCSWIRENTEHGARSLDSREKCKLAKLALLPRRVVAFQGFPRGFVLISTCIFPPSRGNIILLFKTGCAVWKSNAETRYNDSQFSNFFSRSPPVSSEFYIFFLLYGGKQRNIIFHSNCEIQFFLVVVGEKLRGKRSDLDVAYEILQYE